jgi:hypothetical protein
MLSASLLPQFWAFARNALKAKSTSRMRFIGITGI